MRMTIILGADDITTDSNSTTLIRGGETVYDETIEDWQAPPKPELIGAAVKATLNPHYKPPPFLKAMMVAMLGTNIDKAMRDPRLAPMGVTLETRPTGWTLTVDMPPPPDDPNFSLLEIVEPDEIIDPDADR